MIKSICVMVFSVLFACTTATSAETTEINKGYFTIRIPKGFNVQETKAVESDIFYTISHNDKPYLRIYVGNAPRFPRIGAVSDQDALLLRTRDLTIISKWTDKQRVALELLVARTAGPDWPMFVHAWTIADAPEKQVSIRMLLSITVDNSVVQ